MQTKTHKTVGSAILFSESTHGVCFLWTAPPLVRRSTAAPVQRSRSRKEIIIIPCYLERGFFFFNAFLRLLLTDRLPSLWCPLLFYCLNQISWCFWANDKNRFEWFSSFKIGFDIMSDLRGQQEVVGPMFHASILEAANRKHMLSNSDQTDHIAASTLRQASSSYYSWIFSWSLVVAPASFYSRNADWPGHILSGDSVSSLLCLTGLAVSC